MLSSDVDPQQRARNQRRENWIVEGEKMADEIVDVFGKSDDLGTHTLNLSVTNVVCFIGFFWGTLFVVTFSAIYKLNDL